MIFDPKEMIGIPDLRSLDYYKVRQGVLQHNLSKDYHFVPVDALCEQFEKFVSTLKKDKEESKEKYPWLDRNDKRKYMTDREILEKYVNVDNSCLMGTEKIEVRDFLFEYKDIFSLRDETGTCPNIEVEIDIMERPPFLIRQYHAKEKDKNTYDKEMKRLCYMGI